MSEYKVTRNVLSYTFARGSVRSLNKAISNRKMNPGDYFVCFIDHFFKGRDELSFLEKSDSDVVIYVDTTDEPKTTGINSMLSSLRDKDRISPCCVIGIGGGATLDTAKAVANLMTNKGKAEDYQGWDLVKNEAPYKIGVPTLSGTGAEASRTCVMTNPANGLKLGMNSDWTIYNQLIMDPDLTITVPRDQYFYTGFDTYAHCMESLLGLYRHAVSDAFSKQALDLCEEVFMSVDMMSEKNREKMMMASYLGGCAIANSFVGIVHPVSAGLSVGLGMHHGLANCIAMNALSEFYPEHVKLFREMLKRQGVELPQGILSDMNDNQFEILYNSSIIHEKPLINALGEDFRKVLTREKLREIFASM